MKEPSAVASDPPVVEVVRAGKKPEWSCTLCMHSWLNMKVMSHIMLSVVSLFILIGFTVIKACASKCCVSHFRGVMFWLDSKYCCDVLCSHLIMWSAASLRSGICKCYAANLDILFEIGWHANTKSRTVVCILLTG